MAKDMKGLAGASSKPAAIQDKPAEIDRDEYLSLLEIREEMRVVRSVLIANMEEKDDCFSLVESIRRLIKQRDREKAAADSYCRKYHEMSQIKIQLEGNSKDG